MSRSREQSAVDVFAIINVHVFLLLFKGVLDVDVIRRVLLMLMLMFFF